MAISLAKCRVKKGFFRLLNVSRSCAKQRVNYYTCSSMCNGGIYEADFGWLKPTWVSLGGIEDLQGMNMILLVDTRSGNGIEAWMNLSEEDMAEFERDPELLAFASLEPSPLELDFLCLHAYSAMFMRSWNKY
ncbi:hypothetical protein RHMOL_Rhmol13G0186300 [Rhododendron molle]|uniref:Uncharacterized protein n=1 Tax=Rhododendron molle TaxID=49168 RepID=A0ACC0L9A4_RHOML|nr:hypothetical protein RHMOL_Rhmol13G0186300 [Rhododendron molle]